jgi:hypothetical protein
MVLFRNLQRSHTKSQENASSSTVSEPYVLCSADRSTFSRKDSTGYGWKKAFLMVLCSANSPGVDLQKEEGIVPCREHIRRSEERAVEFLTRGGHAACMALCAAQTIRMALRLQRAPQCLDSMIKLGRYRGEAVEETAGT